ncbi:MAG: helix-turn-helix domain-containing protein [Ruminococcaceae bacterium]|nr:helix-turn-helix domain-containing protein [Oscillospiraceae bacterium]
MTIGEKIRDLRLKRGLSQEDIARALGTTKQAVYKYESGIVTNIPVDKLERIAGLLGVSPAYLAGWRSTELAFSELPTNVRPIATRRFPMLGEIACGEPIFAEENHESYVDAAATIDADFCLTAKGDSMTGARIHDGDVVFIRQQPMVENGEIAAVVIENEATLKRWYYYPEDKKLILCPENSAFAPLVFVGAELEGIICLGKAVSFMSHL